MDIKHPTFWFGMGMLIVDTVKKTMSDDCDQKWTSKAVGIRFGAIWTLTFHREEIIFFRKSKNGSVLKRFPLWTSFCVSRALKWWSQKNEIHGEAMGLKLEGYAGSGIFAHGIHPPGHKNLSEDASIRGLKVMAYFLDYSNTPQ